MDRIKIKKETSDRLYWRFGEVFREEIISEQSFAVGGKGVKTLINMFSIGRIAVGLYSENMKWWRCW